MKIILTNDDGIEALGINSLFETLSKKHEVYMIAPDRQRSACSNAITIHDTVKLKKTDTRKYSLSGFPADCVNFGLCSGIFPEPDLVISGINHGPNMGDDIYFSGTVAGARAGYIHFRSAIAASYESFTDFSLISNASEFIREKITLHTKQELPYSAAVEIDLFKEDEARNLIRITATINVEKDSQKAIMIGKKGAMLKKIGTQARLDMENLFGAKVYLELFVRVRKEWTASERMLEEFGLLKH